ncbi:hypothetical protein [Lonepinella koalarum]|uniref:Uncharacterized protein n=1 Tax=Lonepinella koalarum TaxID=53417 RepID=A0A4R1KZQ2_9PAST|nr:hypothetical protein [Lonepinella koalarum]MDH2927904.1 hypothetical protein [Lonepinella koalarum]TCK70100.1 hypothetical protein EV692_1326 [Lonepinella koalarum]TFJ90304.1 hypothetical protein E0709_02895 [Lonepinella koalarum]
MTQPIPQKHTFVSAINGMKFDVQNSLTAELLSKNEKKEIIHREPSVAKPSRRSKANSNDIEQEIS